MTDPPTSGPDNASSENAGVENAGVENAGVENAGAENVSVRNAGPENAGPENEQLATTGFAAARDGDATRDDRPIVLEGGLVGSSSPGVASIGWREAMGVWSRVALLSFGGPTGQIAVMHRVFVEEKRWVDESRFLEALNFCMLLPGPEAQQLATYLGWMTHGPRGGWVAGTLFILPGFLSILGLSVLYVEFQDLRWIAGIFLGLKPAVLVIVAAALLRLAKKVLRDRAAWWVAAVAFAAIHFAGAPFPAVILAAAAWGWWRHRHATVERPTAAGSPAVVGAPAVTGVPAAGGAPTAGGAPAVTGSPAVVGSSAAVGSSAVVGSPAVTGAPATGGGPAVVGSSAVVERRPWAQVASGSRPGWRRSVKLTLWFIPLWVGPLGVLAAWLGRDSIFVQQGLFFGKMACVTFGGAYSVLSYVAQQAVERYGWLAPGEMLDGLGMAETTPGPLIMVVQFVAFMGAYRSPGPLTPLGAGLLASALAVWVTFIPCFYWIFLGAPHIERLRGDRRLAGMLSAISAAVVGVILNLSLWFAAHTLFARVEPGRLGPLRYLRLEWSTWHPEAFWILAWAAMWMFVWRRGMAVTLAASAIAGIALRLLGT